VPTNKPQLDDNIALLRRWLWVRAPPNPNFYFDLESPFSRYRSHSAGGGAPSDQQFQTVVCCCLLHFFWVTLADLTFLTSDWVALGALSTYLAGSRDRRLPLEAREPAHATTVRVLSSLLKSSEPQQTKCRFSVPGDSRLFSSLD
jgi:hypothetical protein